MASEAKMTVEEVQEQPPQHKPLLIVLILLSWLTFITRLLIDLFGATLIVPGLFSNTVTNDSRRSPSEIAPAQWVFSIWYFIYVWNALWLIYATVGICRKNARGYFYVTPELFPPSFYIVWCFNHFLNTSWRFILDSQHLVASDIILALSALTLYYLLYISYRRVDRNGQWLAEHHRTDLWLVRILVHNGLALYATWATLATLVSFVTVLTDVSGYSNEDATTGVLSVLLFKAVVYFLLENSVWERYGRYTLVPFPVVVVALAGIIVRNDFNFEKRNVIYTAVILGLACLLLLVRFCLVIWRHVTKPLYVKNAIKTTSIKMSQLNAGFA